MRLTDQNRPNSGRTIGRPDGSDAQDILAAALAAALGLAAVQVPPALSPSITAAVRAAVLASTAPAVISGSPSPTAGAEPKAAKSLQMTRTFGPALSSATLVDRRQGVVRRLRPAGRLTHL
jgi:hypothetical protein